MHSPTESEYEAFPPAVKRKCFSTLERLRLAQGHATINNAYFPNHSPKPRSSCLSSGNAQHNYLGISLHKRPKTALTCATVSQEDAQWYRRLPDTVRRKQFTVEEQILLAGRRESIILDAADEAIYKLGGQKANRSLPSLQTRSSVHSPAYSDNIEDWLDTAVDMDDSMLDSFRWLDEEDDLDLTLDDYHNHILQTTTSTKLTSSRRPSFRRNLSLTNLPFAHKARLSLPRDVPIPPTNRLSLSTQPSSQPTIPPPETPAPHYSDPSTRLKLRIYLGSPQKFDEALEFGFPAIQAPPPPTPSSRKSFPRKSLSSAPPRRPSLPVHHLSTDTDDAKTFYDDNDSSDSDPDSASLVYSSSSSSSSQPKSPNTPTTPLDPTFLYNSKPSPTSTSTASTARPSFSHTAATEPHYKRVWAGEREMTLRMTLTRPDLRNSDQAVDPLALAQLGTEEGVGRRGSAGGESGLVRRFWRRVGRGRS